MHIINRILWYIGGEKMREIKPIFAVIYYFGKIINEIDNCIHSDILLQNINWTDSKKSDTTVTKG